MSSSPICNKDDQWSPSQPGGRKYYNPEQLQALAMLMNSGVADEGDCQMDIAWQPNEQRAADNCAESLYRSVRGVLNKLTPQTVDVLAQQMSGLNIDTAHQEDVIDLIFEKAINEPNFGGAYARLCRSSAAIGLNEHRVKFHTASNCQSVFEAHVITGSAALELIRPRIAECTDPDAMAPMADEERQLRRRADGTLCFIGELYKLNMLKTADMLSCVQRLLYGQTDAKLEWMCKLLTLVGQTLETRNVDDLSELYDRMQMLVDRQVEHVQVSSRVRFMLLDLVELRRGNWIERRAGATSSRQLTAVASPTEPDYEMSERLYDIGYRLLGGHHFGRTELAGCEAALRLVAVSYRWVVVRELFTVAFVDPWLNGADRHFGGRCCVAWLRTRAITVADYVRGLTVWLTVVEGLAMENTKLWMCTAELLAAPLHAQIITMPVVRAALMHVSPLAGATLMHRYLLPHLHAKYGKHFVKQLRSTGKFLPEASGRRQRRGAARRKPCISSLVAIREAEE